jgi:hypothetical protein
MKKAIAILAAVMVLFSGVAAVSAYEAHVVNVTAHVENAMKLTGVGFGPDYEYDFGTVFPEEWLIKPFIIRVSNSFCETDQRRVLNIDYSIYAEDKPGYEWLGDALYFHVGWNYTTSPDGPLAANMTWVGDKTLPRPVLVLSDSLNKDFNIQDTITMALDVPVFREHYNEYTDALANPEPDFKPSGKDVPTVIIETDESRYPADMSLGVDLGVDIKFQITRIY